MDEGKSVIIIGYGYWGRKVANEYVKLQESDIIKNIYVYDRDRKLLNFKDQRLKIIENINKIPKDVRFAHVCTSNNSHFEVTKQLLENGCSVLVEKPLSEHSLEAEKLEKIAESNSLKLSVGMVYRYSQAVEQSRSLIGEIIGAPRLISASWLHNIDVPNVRRVMMERDVVWDIFIHLLDIINFIFSEWPSFEYSSGIPNSKGQNHTFVATGRIREVNLVMKSSFVSHFKERKIEIIGEKKDLILDILNNVVTVGTDENRTNFYFYDNPLYSEILAFINPVNSNNLSDAKSIGLKETKIIETLLKKQKLSKASLEGHP